jgi:Ca-activated chloride channel family protein
MAEPTAPASPAPLRALRPASATLPAPEPPSLARRLGEALIPYLLFTIVAGVTAIVLAWYFHHYYTNKKIELGRWWALFGLLLLPPLALFYFHLDHWQTAVMTFTRTADLRATGGSFWRRLVHLPRAIRLVAVGLVVIALARPQHPSAETSEVEGIDIVVALDVSNSMSDPDLPPNRITAAKAVLKKIIARRKSDRIGLVIFGREAFTQCPLTLDHRALTSLLDDVRLDLIDGKGTAIGNALGTALNRLRKSDGKGSKVIILLTDGDNNAGNLAPQQAARYAQSLGVKIFTILMGRDVTEAQAPDSFNAFFRRATRYPVNPKLLEEIAGATGGTPYLATNAQALENRLQSILDELDRSKIRDQKGRPQEHYVPFAVAALFLLCLEIALALTRFRRFP